MRVDERSAGFLALGLARASGAPVLVVTTSGTAVANQKEYLALEFSQLSSLHIIMLLT